MSFLKELKRRNVIRVGVAYLLGSWVLLQGADFALDVIGAPDWVIQALVVLAVLGLPAVLVFSWVFEMTPEGLRREKEIDRDRSITPQTGRKLDRVIIAFLVIAVGLLLADRFLNPSRPSVNLNDPLTAADARSPLTSETAQSGRRSVAVLPFAFRSTNPEDEFFAEGMHDDLLTQLAKIGSLKVISRTSVMEYKDTTKKIPEIANELGVATIVEGGVQRSGSRIRINAQLIDAESDEHLWAETFNRELTAENLFEIQAEISRAIADALQATLSPEEEARIGRTPTDSLEAWEAYQNALRLRRHQSTDNVQVGLAEIDHAIALDPDFAAAYSLKAILLMMRYWFYDPSPEIRIKARDSIAEGRRLDPTLPEHDLAEAYYHYWGFLDYDQALSALDKAVSAIPNDDRIHQARAYVLRRQGRFDEAISGFRRASELDPREVTHLADIGNTLSRTGRIAEADAVLEQALALDSDHPLLLFVLGEHRLSGFGDTRMARYYLERAPGSFPETYYSLWFAMLADEDFDAALELIGNWPNTMLDVRIHHVTRPMLEGMTRLYAGETERADRLLLEEADQFEEILENHPNRFTTTRSLCQVEGALGRPDAARTRCAHARRLIPDDAFMRSEHLFRIAVGLALAGDEEGAIELLEESLSEEASMSLHDIRLHPAFRSLDGTEAFAELERRYGEPRP